MSEFVIKPATRTSLHPIIGIYGKSGSGKTHTSLLVARGIAGPKGRVTLIDTENGRGAVCADLIPGGYSIIDLTEPFSPERYEQAFSVAEAASDCVVIDSVTHEWDGEGGVLDMAETALDKMGGGENNKLRSWIKPKMAHKQMVQRFLRSKCPLICCLRGEEKTSVTKDDKGKTRIITDDFSSPLGDKRFIFELLVNFEMIAKDGVGGYCIARKTTHPEVSKLIPAPNEQLGIKFGEALAKWCAGSSDDKPSTSQADKPANLKSELWKLMEPVHHNDKKNVKLVEEHLIKNGLMSDAETLKDLTDDRLKEIVTALLDVTP